MLKQDNYIRLNQDGTTELVSETREERHLNQVFISKLGEGVVHHFKRAFTSNGTAVHLICSKDERYAVQRLKTLDLNAHYELGKDKILRPVFIGKNSAKSTEYVVASANWHVPENMMLLFAARIGNWDEMDSQPFTHHDHACFLVAFDQSKRSWTLPLPNVYEDGAICMGKFNGQGPTAADAFGLALEQFGKSDWNSDLSSPDKEDKSRKLFQFAPSTIGMDCIPFEGDWTNLCLKVATPITNLLGGLL